MIQDHADAILALLRADANLTVYPALNGQPGSGPWIVPNDVTPPYVAVHIHVQRPEASSSHDLTGASGRAVAWAYCHCVGETDIAARAVAQRVATILLDARLTITGRACLPIRQADSVAPTPDESTGRLVMDQVDVYRLETVSA